MGGSYFGIFIIIYSIKNFFDIRYTWNEKGYKKSFFCGGALISALRIDQKKNFEGGALISWGLLFCGLW